MEIKVEKCVFCNEKFVDNPTLDHFAEHMQDGGCSYVTKLEENLNKMAGYLAVSDFGVVLGTVKRSLDGMRGVLVAGNAMFHFDMEYHELEYTEPLCLLPSKKVWQPGFALSFEEFGDFLSKYRALDVVVRSKEKFTKVEYWEEIESRADNGDGNLGVREARFADVLKAIALGDEFWVTAGQFLDIAKPVLTLVTDLTCFCSTVSTLYVSAQAVKVVVDHFHRRKLMDHTYLTSFHEIPRIFGTPLHRAAGVFNPMYMVKKDMWSEVYMLLKDLTDDAKDNVMKGFFKNIVREEEWDLFLADLGTYCNKGPLLARTMSECHPAVFWHVYGHNMYILARYALTIVLYPHSMIYLENETPLEQFVLTQRRIFRPYEGKFNHSDRYSGSFEYFLEMIMQIKDPDDYDDDDHNNLLSQFGNMMTN